ncbi:KUP system potassium uptake protein [Hoeflea marina]|uniref:Probable potassium transport system protein Kup n=1 Tax=Hoeflea marina TaxID=274592 RepID=A0A317PX19_9HYPH|nr:potassium transporter Kup [Hoeflea marina]PWW04040.1 KUP system potassium uptake protein [Hoeflea marina]
MSVGSMSAASELPTDGNPPGLKRNSALALGALGVVYGDIGTSPLYALREAVRASAGPGVPMDQEITGALSIIFWALTLIVTVKYAIFVLRADNKGEGGTLAIMSVAKSVAGRHATVVAALGMIGASLFLGDAVITPAISVLSAVEGLQVAAPQVAHFTVPIAVVILIMLFAVQRFGTGSVSRIFGPITLLWFLVLGASGAVHIIDAPSILRAINPLEAIRFIIENIGVASVVIGAAFLAVTGAEALYVDLGHFGRRPILYAWFGLVFPCLLLNYFGQGAYLIAANAPVDQPFFQMAPDWAHLPLVLLATVATVIASQAVISGAFSLTRQAIQLHFLPRMGIVHTSSSQSGQIYLAQINTILLICVLLLVVGFGSSEAIASAYGISVSGEMLVTTILLLIVMRKLWKWSPLAVLAAAVPFLIIDITFLAANSLKFLDGGWVSILIAGTVLVLMWTWTRGSAYLFQKTRRAEMPLPALLRSLAGNPPHIVPGTAVFLTGDPDSAPTALLHSLKHYKVLHEKNIILTVVTMPQPRVTRADRAEISELSDLFTLVTLRYGFMETPNVPMALAQCRKKGLAFDVMTTSFFLSRRSLVPSRHSGLPMWQDRIFIAMARSATDASSYFALPTSRVVEIGAQFII